MKIIINKIIDYWVWFWSMIFFFGVFINFLEIILRFFFSFSLDLFYDIPVWCTVWATLLISGPILLNHEHVSIDAIQSLVKGKLKKALTIINALIVLIFGIIFTYGSYVFIIQIYSFNTAYTRSISIPAWMVEACVPIGLFIFTCCAIYNLYRAIIAKNNI